MPTPALISGESHLALRLVAEGHVVVGCWNCGRALAADLTHDGHHLPACTRRYCAPDCRDAAAGIRDLVIHAPRRRHNRTHADLIHRHEQEDAGQLPLTADPLPPIPPLEPR